MRDVLIGERVRVKRGATIGNPALREQATGNREYGTVRQVWRGDRLAQVELDRDGRKRSVALRDLRAAS